MERTDTDPDHYIDSLAPETGDDMRRLDRLISEVMADETRTLWEGVFWGGSDQTIIGYGTSPAPTPRESRSTGSRSDLPPKSAT
jgi:hypothetical protein